MTHLSSISANKIYYDCIVQGYKQTYLYLYRVSLTLVILNTCINNINKRTLEKVILNSYCYY